LAAWLLEQATYQVRFSHGSGLPEPWRCASGVKKPELVESLTNFDRDFFGGSVLETHDRRELALLLGRQ
jgi:hypothetical protein